MEIHGNPEMQGAIDHTVNYLNTVDFLIQYVLGVVSRCYISALVETEQIFTIQHSS